MFIKFHVTVTVTDPAVCCDKSCCVPWQSSKSAVCCLLRLAPWWWVISLVEKVCEITTLACLSLAWLDFWFGLTMWKLGLPPAHWQQARCDYKKCTTYQWDVYHSHATTQVSVVVLIEVKLADLPLSSYTNYSIFPLSLSPTKLFPHLREACYTCGIPSFSSMK